LVGRTFLKETEGDEHRFGARAVRAIIEKDNQQYPQYTKIVCKVDGDVVNETLT
jgi:hypothetical protein